MFPLRDLSRTQTTAVVTFAVIALNLLTFFGWQPRDPVDSTAFLYRRAAIACELTTGEPLTRTELESRRCLARPGDAPIFPEKQLPLSVGVSMFLHANLVHLLGNMWFFWIFGDNVEEAFGHVAYAVLYVVAGIAATLGFTFLHPGSVEPLIGASGAIAGVLGAYFVLFPGNLVLALWFLGLVPVPAVIFLGLWFLGQFGVAEAGVAWEAHVTGFVLGAAVALAFRGALLRRVRAARAGAQRSPW